MTFIGPLIDDEGLLSHLSDTLSSLLQQINGFTQYSGGFHLRGACREPLWHSLGYVWRGEGALWKSYAQISADDIPFAQEAMGDQFILRNGIVFRLESETGELKNLNCDFQMFLANVQNDPVGYLSLQPFVKFSNDGGKLEDGQLLNVYPPFCVEHSGEYSYRAISALERLAFLANFSQQIAGVDDGGVIQLKIK